MEDIAPELLANIEREFNSQFDSDELLAELAAKLEAGIATHLEAYQYAGRVGTILTDAYRANLSTDSLPDGKLWYNIANRVITPTMQNNYEIISKYVTDVQTNLNKAAGIGIKAVKPELNADRIDGIINKVSNADSYKDVEWVLDAPIKTFSQSVVDDSIKANVDFHGKSGMTPKIIRKSSGNCCEWCTALVGIYAYPDIPKDVYRRHDNCKCTVDYDPGNGKVQSVHTGREGKRIYVQDGYGGYKKTKEDRIAYAKEMAVTEEERKRIAREKRIATWKKKARANSKEMLVETGESSTIKSNNVDLQFFAKKTNHASRRLVQRGITDLEVDDAITNPIYKSEVITDEQGRKSVKYIGKDATVILNPESKEVITSWRTGRRVRKKFEEGD